MSGFDFVLMLLSFVYALGLGHVLTSLGRLLVRRDQVIFSGLLALAMANAMLQVFVSWLSLWDFRSVERWDLPEISLFFSAAVIVYLMCVVISPEPEYDQDNDHRIDLERVFWRNHRWFYGTYAALLLTYIGVSLIYLETKTPELALKVALSNLPYLALALVGVIARRIWVQWAVGVLMLGLTAYWLVVFTPSLD
jgi:hypothetical protein